MKSIHITIIILCCFCYYVHSIENVEEAESRRELEQWKLPPITKTTTEAPPMPKYPRQIRRSQMSANNENRNEENIDFALGRNSTDVLEEDVEKEDNDKEFDHKHRVLLAVQSDVKYRDRANKRKQEMETVKSEERSAQSDTPATKTISKTVSKNQLKQGLKDILSKLHPIEPSADPFLRKSKPTNEITSQLPKMRQFPKTMASRKPQRRTYLRTLKCEDIPPHSEALLHSGLVLNEFKNLYDRSSYPMWPQPAVVDGARDFAGMQRNFIKSHHNPMKFFPAYHGHPPIAWSHNTPTYNPYHIHNPYNMYDCDYNMDTVNGANFPLVQYVWDDSEYDEYPNMNDMNMINGNVRTKK